MSRRDYIVVGHLTIDIIEIAGESHRSLGGSVAYGSVAAKMYGHEPLALSKVGEDFPEEYILLLAKYGVDVSGIRRVGGGSTIFKLIYHGSSRDLFLMNTCEKIFSKDIEDLEDIEATHIGSVFNEIPLETVKYLARKSRLTAIDIQGYIRRVDDDRRVVFEASDKVWDLMSHVDIIHAEQQEAFIVTGHMNPVDSASRIFERSRAISAVTLGEGGSIIACSEGVYRIPAIKPERTLDPTGAGDIYTAILLLSLSEGEDLLYSGALASVASSLSVEDYGLKGIPGRTRVFERVEEVYDKTEKIRA